VQPVILVPVCQVNDRFDTKELKRVRIADSASIVDAVHFHIESGKLSVLIRDLVNLAVASDYCRTRSHWSEFRRNALSRAHPIEAHFKFIHKIGRGHQLL